MSNGYRNGAFALGVVVGTGLVLNLVLWSAYVSDKVRERVANPPENDQHNQYVVGSWDWFISSFIIPGDTIAQWLMAVLSLAAVYLLWETLKASRRTLQTTQEMARDTREVGESQIRPWVSISDFKITSVDLPTDQKGEVTAGHALMRYQFAVENHGNSPANNIKIVSSRAIHIFAKMGDHTSPDMPISQTVDLLSSDSTQTGRPKVSLPPRQKETISESSFIDIYDGNNIPENAIFPAIVVCLVYTYRGTSNRVERRTWASYRIGASLRDPKEANDFSTILIISPETIRKCGKIEAVRHVGDME